MNRFAFRLVSVLALAALLASPARADSGWEFQAAPYLWLFFLKGDIGGGGQEVEVDSDFTDLFDQNGVIGFEGNFQARNGPWTILADPTWLRVKSDIRIPAGPAELRGDVTTNIAIVDLMVLREVARWPLGEPPAAGAETGRAVALDLLGGMRIQVQDVDLDVDISTPGPFFDDFTRELDNTEAWADPVVGARATFDLTNQLHLGARGDVGGFHIASDLTSEMWAGLTYDFRLFGWERVGFYAGAGYRALYTDYDNDGGFLYQTWLHGPTIGSGVRF